MQPILNEKLQVIPVDITVAVKVTGDSKAVIIYI